MKAGRESKLPEAVWLEIKAQIESGIPRKTVAARYGMHISSIGKRFPASKTKKPTAGTYMSAGEAQALVAPVNVLHELQKCSDDLAIAARVGAEVARRCAMDARAALDEIESEYGSIRAAGTENRARVRELVAMSKEGSALGLALMQVTGSYEKKPPEALEWTDEQEARYQRLVGGKI
jgi:hypothetical protein